ncbi:MAG TPA: hypothetical protein PL160_00005, partial [Candidatus Cloacimonas sp.]|nr:hypothetical protein [Candidatus Cloacimonas sp.]
LHAWQVIKRENPDFYPAPGNGTKSKVASWLSSIAESPCSRYLCRCRNGFIQGLTIQLKMMAEFRLSDSYFGRGSAQGRFSDRSFVTSVTAFLIWYFGLEMADVQIQSKISAI